MVRAFANIASLSDENIVMRAAIVGAGNFGTAVANIIAKNGHCAYLWTRDPEQLAEMRAYGENRRYLKGFPLERNVIPTCDMAVAVGASDIVFLTVPTASFREVTREVAPHVPPGVFVVSGTKGVEAHGFHLMSQILDELLPQCATGVISGPNLAEEMASNQYAGTVVASRSDALRRAVQTVLRSAEFRVYSSADVYGVELGGALKNIYAIICGMAAALEVGQNTVGMLITRSLAEMSRFAVSLGANPFTFLGLAGVGDLVVTCTSPLSRNFQLGYRVANGNTLDEAMDQLGKLAEGVNTLKGVRDKSMELNVHMPLMEGLYDVLFNRADIAAVIAGLMTGEAVADVEFAAPKTWSYER